MRVIVCGTRGYVDNSVQYALREALQDLWPIDEIIHGDCPNSADELASQYAHEYGIVEWAYPADWEGHGKAAGFMRNFEMAKIENVDECIAIWDGKSRGTEHMIKAAVQKGIFVRIIPASIEA